MEMASDAGWLEVEQTLTAMELPPVPPTSDPQRLLSYVVNIQPKYTEMEMLSTHLRLHAATLEQEMEQVRGHVRVLSREVESEREKRQFLERYAAQLVKERNELLHAKGAKQSKKNGAPAPASSTSGHFAWHACCKKNATHTMDMTPSINAFRGEKLRDAVHQMKNLQDEIRNQEMLRREMDFLLKKTQREHDSKLVADRKNIHQLERQLLQRSMLFSTLERKLYEVETSLAKHDQVKDEQMNAVNSKLQAGSERIERLEKDNEMLSNRVKELVAECDYLSKKLSAATEAKNSLAERLDKLNELQEAAEAEIDSLRSEIELLQSTDIRNVRSEYAARIQKLQRETASREQDLQFEVDRLRQELKKSEKVLSRESPKASVLKTPHPTSAVSPVDGVMDISLSADGEWRESLHDRSILLDGNEGKVEEYSVGSSLSRSQLSDSSSSLSRSESSGSAVARTLFLASRSQRSEDKRHASQAALVTGEVHGDNEEDTYGHEDDRADEASNASSSSFFNWESFIDSPSECSTPDAKRTKRMNQLDEDHHSTSSVIERELQKANAELQRLELASPALPATGADVNGEVAYEKSFADSKMRTSRHHHAPASIADSANYDGIPDLEYSEEEKDEEKEQSGDLAQELRDMLGGFERKRIEEERKAALAEQALQQFQKTQQGGGFE